jgi:hypothetical protein
MAQTVIAGGFVDADLVSAQTALTTGLVSTDELIISDAGVLKRMDISVLESYIVTNLGDNNIDVAQSTHGFAVGDIIRLTTTNNTYAKALADTAANAESVGVVIDVTDTNNFTYSTSGEITVAGAVPNSTTAGDIVFLSTSSAGGTQTTEPSVTDQISKPLAVITEANNKMILLPYRGEIISGGATNFAPVDATYLAISANGTLTGERVLTAGTGITLTDAGANGAATLSITDDSVTFAKMQNVAANSVLVRNASSSGDLAELALATTQILIGDGTGFTAAALSGDVTMTNAGGVTVASSHSGSAHHADAHTVVSHSDTTATGAELETLTDGSTTSLHAHSGGGPSQAVQTDIEQHTNQDTYIPPDLMKHVPGVGMLGIITSRVTINNDNTYTSEPEWTFPVEANHTYGTVAHFIIRSDDEPDFKMKFSGPSGASGYQNYICWGMEANSGVVKQGFMHNMASDEVITLPNTGANTLYAVHMWGFFTISTTAGNVAFQWAQNTSHANDTDLWENSFMQVHMSNTANP